MKNYYHILQIEYTANAFQIKKAYRSLAKIYHPDTNRNEANKQKFQEINDAYHTLISPELKSAYDINLKNYYESLINSDVKNKNTNNYNKKKYTYHKPNPKELFIDKYNNYIIASVFILIISFVFLAKFLLHNNDKNINNFRLFSNKDLENNDFDAYSIIKQDEFGNQHEVKLSERSQFILDSILISKEKYKKQPLTKEEINIIQNLH